MVDFLNKIITGAETWCFVCDPETKQQSSECVGETSSQPKKLKFQRSCIKIILIIFFNSQGVMHKEFTPEGKAINAEYYKGGKKCLLKCIQRVHPAAFCSQDFLLLHDNAPVDKAAISEPPKSNNHLSPPHTLQIYLCQTIFCSPS